MSDDYGAEETSSAMEDARTEVDLEGAGGREVDEASTEEVEEEDLPGVRREQREEYYSSWWRVQRIDGITVLIFTDDEEGTKEDALAERLAQKIMAIPPLAVP